MVFITPAGKGMLLFGHEGNLAIVDDGFTWRASAIFDLVFEKGEESLCFRGVLADEVYFFSGVIL